jgi:hypothetical protein
MLSCLALNVGGIYEAMAFNVPKVSISGTDE